MTQREKKLFLAAQTFLENTYNNASKKYHAKTGRNVKYRFEHSMRVFHIAYDLAKREEVSTIVCGMAAILHDVAKFEAKELKTEHTTLGAIMVKPFLETLDLTQEEQENICYAISAHSTGESSFAKKNLREAILLQAADDIDRFDYLKTYTVLSDWKLDSLTVDEAIAKLEEAIADLQKELENVHTTTDYVQNLLIKHINQQISFYQELLRQFNISHRIY